MTFIAFGNTPPGASSFVAAALFGTGADGNVTISSGTTTLTRPMMYNSLTISGTGKLQTNGHPIFIANLLDLSAAAAQAIYNANAVSPFSPGIVGGRSSISGGTGVGGNGTAATPSSSTYGYGGISGSAGAGGAGVSAGGAGGTGGTYTNQAMPSFISPHLSLFYANAAAFSALAGLDGASGGAGGGDGANAGGASGAGGTSGGSVLIYARTIARGSNATAAIIQAKGQAGSNGSNSTAGNTGGGGGGAGAGGGLVYIVAGQMIGATIANAIDVSGGQGGNGGNGQGTGKGGAGGSSGNGGAVHIHNLSAGTYSTGGVTWNTPGNAGSTTATATGASGGAVVTVQGNL